MAILLDEERQEDNTYALDYESYKSEREKNKSYSERFKKLGKFESSYDFQWLPEAETQEEVNEDLIEKRSRWQKSLKKDIYISEALNVLSQLKIGVKQEIVKN